MGMVVIHRDNKATTSSNSDDNNLAGLEEHIKCPLCHDFLTDAVTLVGCLHFFCRSCLRDYFKSTSSVSPSSGRHCPKCLVQLGPAEPIYRRDKKLQEMVYKLVPDLFWRQLRRVARRRRHRHRSSSISAHGDSPSSAGRRAHLMAISSQLCSPNEKISLQVDYVPLANVFAAAGIGEESYGLTAESRVKADEKPKEKHSFRRFFRCPAKVRVEHLKRLLESKLAMTEIYGIYFVDPELRNILEDDYSLEELVQMFNWSREGPFQLKFTLARLPQEEEDRPPVLEEMPQLNAENDGPMEQLTMMTAEAGKRKEMEQQQQETSEMNCEKMDSGDDGGGEKTKETATTKMSKMKKNSSSSPPKMPSHHSSPPVQIPRLSTAGVSPLRPVTTLITTLGGSPPPPPTTTTTTNEPAGTISKKRRRSSTCEKNKKNGEVAGGGQPPEKEPKMMNKEDDENAKDKEKMKNEEESKKEEELKKNHRDIDVKIQQHTQEANNVPDPQQISSQSVAPVPPPLPPISSDNSQHMVAIPGPPLGKPKRQRPPKPKQPPKQKPQQQPMAASFTSSAPPHPINPPPIAASQLNLLGSSTPLPSHMLPSPHHQFPAGLPFLPSQPTGPSAATAFPFLQYFQQNQANVAYGEWANVFQGMSPQQQVQIMLGGIAAIAGAAVQQQQQQTKVATTTTAPGTEMAQPKVTAQKGGKNGSRTTGTCGKQLKMNGTGGEGQKSLAATKTGQANPIPALDPSSSLTSTQSSSSASSSTGSLFPNSSSFDQHAAICTNPNIINHNQQQQPIKRGNNQQKKQQHTTQHQMIVPHVPSSSSLIPSSNSSQMVPTATMVLPG